MQRVRPCTVTGNPKSNEKNCELTICCIVIIVVTIRI